MRWPGLDPNLEAIQRLLKAYREALLLRFIEGLIRPEFADMTGLTHGSVRVNLSRRMAILREMPGLKVCGEAFDQLAALYPQPAGLTRERALRGDCKIVSECSHQTTACILWRMKRRSLITLFAGAALKGASSPIRRLTQPPGFHWFGYYDKLQFDPSGRFVLCQQVSFEHRSPSPDDEIRIGLIDTQDKDRWREIGRTRAWNWQQGSMLQWLPKSSRKLMWNDRVGNQFVCRIFDIVTNRTETIPAPVYNLSPGGRFGIAPDFRRLNDCRPGYGYAGIADPNRDKLVPEDAGLWRIDLKSGKQKLLIPFSTAVAAANREPYSRGAKHWFNHLLFSPDGERFIFLHRWRGEKEGKGFSTRMFTADKDGQDLYILDPYGKTSHFIWRDEQSVLAWAWHPSEGKDRFFLYRDKTGKVEAVGRDVMTVNGHCAYLPGNRWILNDTYPDKDRLQHLYLFEVASGKRVAIADLLSPPEYAGEWRTDLHPRFSPDGKMICIDSTHEGLGRQLYLIDIRSLV